MSLSFSTALRDRMLTQGSVKSIIDGLVLRIYGGPVPGGDVPADTSLSSSNTMLVEVTVDDSGTGLTWEGVASGGAITKASAEVWEGTVLATGSPTFFRLESPSDVGGSVGTEVRIQGTAGTGAKDLVLTTAVLTLGDVRRLGYAQIVLPPK